jgi:hypothetical protein
VSDVGGRGSSSGRISSSGSFSFQHDESVQKLDNRAVSEFEQAVHDVLSDFGLPDDTVTRINGYMLNLGRGPDGIAGANGFDEISLNPDYFADYSKASGLTTDNGYLIAGGIKGIATHEVGHVIARQVLKKMMPGASNLEIAKARRNDKAEKAIIKEAKKRFGSNPPISPYGSKKVSEKVAEAVSDVYTNGSKAKPYSKVIVEVMKDMLR